MISLVKDMVGHKFGKLTIISRAASTRDGKATWNCICDCGNSYIGVGKSLRTGNTSSCGCLRYCLIY